MLDGRRRTVIENVSPQVDCGRYPIKRAVGERVRVHADIFTDGHDVISARLLHRGPSDFRWSTTWMRQAAEDSYFAEFSVFETGEHLYTVEAWIDVFKTWQGKLRKRYEADQDLNIHLRAGAHEISKAAARAHPPDRDELERIEEMLRSGQPHAVRYAFSEELTELMERYPDTALATRYEKELKVTVERREAGFSAWYEMFPRSLGAHEARHGTFRDCIAMLPKIREMGFNVLYFPPIHPIGASNRKGCNNATNCAPQDPGSPWAIGSAEGGHKSINPLLGGFEDFEVLLQSARREGIELALDVAFQCAPDHPYVQSHPQWFSWLPDKTVQHAENPPKKYEDILPLNFQCDDWQSLWAELLSVVVFWAEKGIRIFRVDNPHTKPIAFWEWLIGEVKQKYPDTIFLAEAFTKRKVMYALAKAGFSQSYTYFTWRTTKAELADYITELTQTGVCDYFRPNFWPNTPDILPRELQSGEPAAFVSRLILAATLSSNYGIYGPVFERMESAAKGEEYLDSEKYQLRDWRGPVNHDISAIVASVNRIRVENPALHSTTNVSFVPVDNDQILAYLRITADFENLILVLVSFDFHNAQQGILKIPRAELRLEQSARFPVTDLLSGTEWVWSGDEVEVELDPVTKPALILELRPRLERYVS